MKARFALLPLMLSLLACAQQPPQPPEPAPAAAPQTAAPPAAPAALSAPSEAQVAPGRWNVERVRCADLLGASDDDRAAAAMFYYGYLAAKAGIHIIDVSQIEGNIEKVMRQCAAAPQMTVPQAFGQALRSRSTSG
jgi:pyruvate/2-oxoglutarate dehydrogenase complex dihydrolipoamide acyltransferase (E2) component